MRPALLGALLLLCGCAATPRESHSFVPVSTERAVLRWQRGDKILTTPAAISRSAENGVRLRVGKPSEPSLLEITLSPQDRLEARGSLIKNAWNGHRTAAPPNLAIWGTFLVTWQNAEKLPPGEKEIHTLASRVAYSTQGKNLRTLSITDNDTGEIIGAIFE